jgi:hypothetical protein
MSSPFASQIAELARGIVEEYGASLSRVGLRANCRGVTRAIPTVTEVTIDFYRGNDLIDSMEFFVERDGKPVVSAHEIDAWLRRELAKRVDAHLTDS